MMSPPEPLPSPPGRPALRFVILAVAALILLDTAPSTCAVHDQLKQGMDPILDMTGLWQGTWQLFAPNVDKRNIRVEAEVLFSDGERTLWHSPDWPRLSGWQRFLLFRHQEYYDNLRMDHSSRAWPALARHLARTVTPPGGGAATVERITLKRTWSDIPKLKPGDAPVPAGPYENFARSYVFYTWTPASSQ